jgi:hypothetical protein
VDGQSSVVSGGGTFGYLRQWSADALRSESSDARVSSAGSPLTTDDLTI